MKPSNLLSIESLNNEWRDKDNIILHACFQLLKDCVENENLLNGNTDWEADERHSKAHTELEALYHWWLTRSKEDDGLGASEKQYEKDDEMLHRLINVRWAMWT